MASVKKKSPKPGSPSPKSPPVARFVGKELFLDEAEWEERRSRHGVVTHVIPMATVATLDILMRVFTYTVLLRALGSAHCKGLSHLELDLRTTLNDHTLSNLKKMYEQSLTLAKIIVQVGGVAQQI